MRASGEKGIGLALKCQQSIPARSRINRRPRPPGRIYIFAGRRIIYPGRDYFVAGACRQKGNAGKCGEGGKTGWGQPEEIIRERSSPFSGDGLIGDIPWEAAIKVHGQILLWRFVD